MPSNPEIICHLEKKLSFTAFESLWVPSSARFVAVGCDWSNLGHLGVYELSGGAIKEVHQLETPASIRCASFGAASLEERHLATGDFGGHIQLWDLERLDSPISTTEAHHEMINCIDGIGGNGSGGGGFDGGGSSLIATGSRDGFVKIWDPRQSAAAALIGPDEGQAKRDCWSVAFGTRRSGESNDDDGGNSTVHRRRVLAAGYDNGDLKLFDLRQMSPYLETNVKHGICSLDFGENEVESLVVASTANGDLHVRSLTDTVGDFACGAEKAGTWQRKTGHDSTVWRVSHLPQNHEIFMTAGGDGSLSLWRHNSNKNSDDEDSEMVTAGAKKRISLLSTTSISKEGICGFAWHPDKSGLSLACAFDQTLNIVIVTKLHQ